MDAMAANGLRYGAAVEIRQNFGAAPQAEFSANGGSGYTSTQTLFVRRAFAYVAGDQWGIVRLGEMDGLIGTYDEGGTTTGAYLAPSGILAGGELQITFPPNATFTPYFAAQTGNEYANTKFVYLSPSFDGFDVGFQYAPNPFNGFTDGNSCVSAASATCANLASSSDPGSGSVVQNHTPSAFVTRAPSVRRRCWRTACTWAADIPTTPAPRRRRRRRPLRATPV